MIQVIGLSLLALSILFFPKPYEEPWQRYASSVGLIIISAGIAYAARFVAAHYILEIGVFIPKQQQTQAKNSILKSLSAPQGSQIVQNPTLRVVTGGVFKNTETYFSTAQVTTKNMQMLFPSQHRQADSKALQKVTDYFFFRLKDKKFFYLMDITSDTAFLDRDRMYQLFGSKELRNY